VRVVGRAAGALAGSSVSAWSNATVVRFAVSSTLRLASRLARRTALRRSAASRHADAAACPDDVWELDAVGETVGVLDAVARCG
jgi:hypothetical protein